VIEKNNKYGKSVKTRENMPELKMSNKSGGKPRQDRPKL
jgi:hypothetical protein